MTLDHIQDSLLPAGKVVLDERHAQLQEMVSALRICYHLMVPDGNPYAETLRLLQEFWNLLP